MADDTVVNVDSTATVKKEHRYILKEIFLLCLGNLAFIGAIITCRNQVTNDVFFQAMDVKIYFQAFMIAQQVLFCGMLLYLILLDDAPDHIIVYSSF